MEIERLAKTAFEMWKENLEHNLQQETICLLGPPGIGKSSVTYEIVKLQLAYVLANPGALKRLREAYLRINPEVDPETVKLPSKAEIKAVCRILDLSSMLPEDLLGLPFRDGLWTKYCPHGWLGELCAAFAFGVLTLDDLPASAPVMQVAGRQVALEARVHDHRLSPGILIMVTGNRREDKSAASTLPAHFRNSVTMLKVDPDLEGWCKWYGAQHNHDPIVAGFLRWKTELLSTLPVTQDKASGAFATPRTWAKLGKLFKVADRNECLFEVAAGLVGEENATTFLAYVEVRNTLVDPESVFDDPHGTLPKPEKMLDEPSKIIAMSTALGEIGARRSKKGKGKQKTEAPEKLLRALAHAMSGNNEHCSTGVYTFLNNGGSLVDLARVARTYRADPVIGHLLSHLKSSLLGGGGDNS